MLDIRYSTKFKKDYKTIMKRGYNPKLLETVLNLLCTNQALPPKYRDHPPVRELRRPQRMSHYSGLAVDIQNRAEHIDPHINQNRNSQRFVLMVGGMFALKQHPKPLFPYISIFPYYMELHAQA